MENIFFNPNNFYFIILIIFFLGWQYVALGSLIVVVVIFFPEGIMGWLRKKYPKRFGELVDEEDRKAQVELK